MRTIVFALMIITVMPLAQAEHYQIKDEDGNVIYDVEITHSPEVPNLGAYFGLNISVNGSDNKPVSDASIDISGFDGTEIGVRTVAGTTNTVRGLCPVDVCVTYCRTRDIGKLIISVNRKGPLIYELAVSHRMPQTVDQSIVASMCGAFGMSGAASAAVGGNGDWLNIGGNLVVATLNTNMDAIAGSSAGYALDTSIAGTSCSNAAGVQTTTGNTAFLPDDGCVLPTLYIISKSSTLQLEAGISGTFGGNPARCGSANASSSLFCQSGDKPCRKEFTQGDTSNDFAEHDGVYQTVSKDTVLKSSQIANSEFVAGNAACGSVMNLGEGGAVTTGRGEFTNFTQLTANIYSKPPAVEP